MWTTSAGAAIETIKEAENTRLLVQDVAENVLSAYEITIPIKDIESVVLALGGKLKRVQDTDGVRKTDNDGFDIECAKWNGKSEEQIHWAVAVMIGDLFIHMGYNICPSIWRTYKDDEFFVSNDVVKIRQSQAFARAFLMPENEFRNIAVQNKYNVRYIATYFTVPAFAVRERLREIDTKAVDINDTHISGPKYMRTVAGNAILFTAKRFVDSLTTSDSDDSAEELHWVVENLLNGTPDMLLLKEIRSKVQSHTYMVHTNRKSVYRRIKLNLQRLYDMDEASADKLLSLITENC